MEVQAKKPMKWNEIKIRENMLLESVFHSFPVWFYLFVICLFLPSHSHLMISVNCFYLFCALLHSLLLLFRFDWFRWAFLFIRMLDHVYIKQTNQSILLLHIPFIFRFNRINPSIKRKARQTTIRRDINEINDYVMSHIHMYHD